MTEPRIAIFRPDDHRMTEATETLEDLGVEPVPDPLLAVDPTGASPRTDADIAVLTSVTGAELVADKGWDGDDGVLCAIGPATAFALESDGFSVDVVPDTYTSSGLVTAIRSSCSVDGASVEIARSDHGSDALIDGLVEAGGYVHETVLYRLVRPSDSGRSTEALAAGQLDGLCFTSSLTVEHFLEAASERGVLEAVRNGTDDVVIGAIGEPTRRTAEDNDLPVQVVPDRETFDDLAAAVVDSINNHK